ncbi:MAG: ABC transporter permease [Bacteroidales bacterium]|nr:ABC transporter permease [Bacteroidales bacterium]
MKLSLFIAGRYLISKKTHNAINLVSMVSVLGVTVSVAAMIVTLSVFNGFQDLLGGMYSQFDPEIKIKVKKGKTFTTDAAAFEAIRQDKEVAVYTETLEENALLTYKDAQTSAVIKGVEDNFAQLTNIDSLMYAGQFKLNEYDFEYATLGVGIASILGTGQSFIDPITIHVPRRTSAINLANPAGSYKTYQMLVCGTFGLNQPEYDDNYVIVPMNFARELFEYENAVTAVEIKLKEGVATEKAINRFARLLGDDYSVHGLMEQKADFYRINRVEKWMTYLILTFILLIALFNVIGSLSMLILEKRADAQTLSNLGADRTLIRRVFLTEGRLIVATGAILGIILGSLGCWLQQTFGLLKLGGGGHYIVDAYPVVLQLTDVLLILVTTLLISLPATWWPVQLYFNRNSKGSDDTNDLS